MIKWFAYIVLMLVVAPALLSAKDRGHQHVLFDDRDLPLLLINHTTTDTALVTKNAKHPQDQDDKKKIKEIGKAKRQPKPEKIVPDDASNKKKKRVRRPEGMERPPEIPRRSGD